MDLISVIVPVYNVEKYLARCLDSLVNQTYQNIEIIIIDDGSTDSSNQIIKKYEDKYPKLIKAYHKKNGGLSDARNFGLNKAQGEYILFVDSDDYVDHDFVEKLYQNIVINKSDIAICNIIDEYENKKNTKIYTNYVPSKVGNIYQDKRILLNRFATWNKLYKRTLFENKELKFAQGKIYEDVRLIPKLYLSAQSISFVNDALYHYVIRNNSIMTSSSLDKNLDIISAFEDFISFYQKRNVYERFQDEIEKLAIDHIVIATFSRVVVLSQLRDLKKNTEPYYTFMDKYFPKYMQNKYLDTLSTNHKLILTLVYNRNLKILKMLVYLYNKLK